MEAVESAWAGLSPQEGDVRKREKKKTKEGEKVAPAKARFRLPYTKNFFFWFTSIWVLRDPSRLNIGSYETESSRKPYAKEVPETDYLTQREQYLNRTTLRRLKIPLRSICTKEGRTIALEQSVSEKLSNDKRQSTFFSRVGYPW